MKKIRITTPENIEVEYTLADLGSRTAAAAVDTAIQMLLYILLAVAIWLIFRFSPGFWADYYGWVVGIALLLYAFISYGYFIVMELAMNGMTPGKRLLKLRAIRSNGQSLTLKHSAIRNLFRIFIDNLGVGVVLIFFSRQHKRLGDYAASTIVVAEASKTSPITLEGLQLLDERLRYYISEEEYELLREYFARKDHMADCSELREALRQHFATKFEDLGIQDKGEWL